MYPHGWVPKVEITILVWCNTTLARHLHNPPRANLTMSFERKVLQSPPCLKILLALHTELVFSYLDHTIEQ